MHKPRTTGKAASPCAAVVAACLISLAGCDSFVRSRSVPVAPPPRPQTHLELSLDVLGDGSIRLAGQPLSETEAYDRLAEFSRRPASTRVVRIHSQGDPSEASVQKIEVACQKLGLAHSKPSRTD